MYTCIYMRVCVFIYVCLHRNGRAFNGRDWCHSPNEGAYILLLVLRQK